MIACDIFMISYYLHGIYFPNFSVFFFWKYDINTHHGSPIFTHNLCKISNNRTATLNIVGIAHVFLNSGVPAALVRADKQW